MLVLLGMCVGLPGAVFAAMSVNKDFTVEDCGTPVKRRKLASSTLYRHPETGRLHLFMDYLASSGLKEYPDPPHQYVDVELKTGEVRKAMGAAPGPVSTEHIVHPNGKLYIYGHKPASLEEFDPVTGETRLIGQLAGFWSGPYKIEIAPGGRIYFGHINGPATSYDPEADEIAEYGLMGNRPTHWGVYTMAVREPWVYCGMANHGRWFLSVLDTRTGEKVNYFDQELKQEPLAVSPRVTRTRNGTIRFGNYILKDGKPLMDEEGAPVKPAEPDDSPVVGGGRYPRRPGMWRVTTYAGPEDEAEDIGLEFDTADAIPTNWNGGVATVRWRNKGKETWRTIRIEGIDLVGCTPKTMAVTPEGNLIGGCIYYGPIFRFDPDTGKSERIGDAPGELYNILVTEENVYFCGYVSFLAVYDRSKPYAIVRNQPWEKDANPKRYRTLGKRTVYMVRGADGRIYTAGSYGRHTYGGGVAVFDPQTEEMESIREPFENLAINGLCFVNDGRRLVITTSPSGRNAPERGSIFLYDTETRKITRKFDVDLGVRATGTVFDAGDGSIVGVVPITNKNDAGEKTYEGLIYKVDVDRGEVLFRRRFDGRPFSGTTIFDLRTLDRSLPVGPDGCAWLFIDEWLSRIHPDGTIQKIRKMEHRGRLLFDGETLYVYNGGRAFWKYFSNVLRIRDLFQR